MSFDADTTREVMVLSIQSTIDRIAMDNERTIATVRVALLGVLCVIEVGFAVAGGGLEFAWRMPTFIFFGLAVVLFGSLRRGLWHPAIPLLAPMLDAGLILARMQPVFVLADSAQIAQNMELSTIMAASALLMVAGAFRLRREALLASSSLALVVYVWFAAQLDLPVVQMGLHIAMLLALAGVSWALTRQVARVARAEVARSTLSRMLPDRVISRAHSDPLALVTQPRSVEATVLITDIRGFTAWAQHRSPMEVLAFLNVIQGTLAEIVRENEGTVDKFMGDGMLAVFGAPETVADHAARAVSAARSMRSALEEIARDAEHQGLKIGIGIHTGELVVGCLGSGYRLEFTVLGDTVNTSSRLESMTKGEGVDVLMSQDTVSQLEFTHGLQELRAVDIRGRDTPLMVWTMIA